MNYTYEHAVYDFKLSSRRYSEVDFSLFGFINKKHPAVHVNQYLKEHCAGFMVVTVIESPDIFFVCDETGNNIDLTPHQQNLFRNAVNYLYTECP